MLVVHRSASGTVLVSALARVLAVASGDPFAAEVVAVPAKGVERWIAQRLSHTLGALEGDGVCANVRFPWPGAVVDDALRAVAAEGAHRLDALERWAPSRVVWPLLETIDECLTEPWCRTLAHHLGDDAGNIDGAGITDKGRRVATATRLAGLFDEYGQSRPAMVRAWAQGRGERGDGTDLPLDLAWQAQLWRRLRERIDTPSPAEMLDDACARLREQPALVDLPSRLSVFGASRLSPARLAVLAALAEGRDVHLWLNHPSPALWQAVADSPTVVRRADDRTRGSLRHPLLASMSRDLIELQHLVRTAAPDATHVHHEAPPPPATLLGWLQHDLATDTTSGEQRVLGPHDRSVQVHACHGRGRQVEVLREVVLGLLAQDPTLEPRDVLVMCPDVEAFAPLIAAAFSLGAEEGAAHPAARLRVRLADRALRQTNALLEVMSQVLDLGTARISAPQVLDLAGSAAVRRRFGFDADDLERLNDWVVGAGVRWGLDAEHRSQWQLGSIAQGTWRAGVDRVLLGATMEGERAFDGVVPLDDVDSADLDLAGRFAELLDRLADAQTLMAGRHSVTHWLVRLGEIVQSLAATSATSAWQQAQFMSMLDDARLASGDSPALLGLADVRALLAGTLVGRPTRASFRTGTMTVCTLVPMRSVPHRVICVVGLDDGSFPRQSTRDGDDVLARDPWVGERDPRSEDRQLLVDAVSAAGEHLVLTYSGADERTGATIPPAVPLGELLDALDRTARTVDGGAVRETITTRHPLQPFDARNFEVGPSVTSGSIARPFSFDRAGLTGALAARGERAASGPFLEGPLPASPVGDVELADLRTLLLHPARGFLRHRLQVAVTRADEDPDDALAIALDGLQEWALGERLLARRAAGVDPATCIALELRSGLLPPGPLGQEVLRRVGGNVEPVVAASVDERAPAAQSHDVDLTMPDGTRLLGTVTGVRGDVLLNVTYSRVKAKQRLEAWLNLVALTAAHPHRPWRAVTVGRAGRGGAVRALVGPVPPEQAQAAVVELVQLYRAGLQAPLPLALKTGAEYAERREHRMLVPSARVKAEREWTGGSFPGERADAEHVLVYGADAPLQVLTGHPPTAHERGPGWAADEDDRFGLLARRLWHRLLAAERLENS